MPSRKHSPVPGPRLRLAATLWSLVHHPSAGREWSLARKVAAVQAAGFEGVQAPYRPELMPELRRQELQYLGAFDAGDPAQFARQVRELVTLGAVVANAQVGEHDTTPADAVRLVVALMAEAEKQGLRVHVETHRDTATETPEKFAAIAAGYRQATGKVLPVTWDHSHFAVVKHMKPPDFAARLLTDPESVQRSGFFHARPFNGHHCQVPVTNARGRLTPEFNDWLNFMRALFRVWREGAAGTDELWVVPELGNGPNGYFLSVFNPPWPDAIRCAQELRRIWQELEQSVSS